MGKKQKRSRDSCKKRAWVANLPTCFRKARNHHAEDAATWARHTGAIHWAHEVFLTTRSTSELHGESFTLEVTAICQVLN